MRDFIENVRARSLGQEHDIQFYIETVENIVKRVHRTRLSTMADIVDIIDFLDKCWEKMEKQLVPRIRDLEFANDSKLVSFIGKSFSNLLHEIINEQVPDLDTRKKQMRRSLKKHCLASCSKMCHCWKLNKYKNQTLKPASYEKLKEDINNIPTPKITYPKHEDSKRGPSINDNEMANYLATVIDRAGGMTTNNSLIEFIKEMFTSGSTKIISSNDIELAQSDTIMGQDHFIMAYEICSGMDSNLKELYYLRYTEEKTMNEIAEYLGVSLGTVANKLNDLDDYLKEYFGSTKISEQEKTHAVLFLVSKWIIDEREKDHANA